MVVDWPNRLITVFRDDDFMTQVSPSLYTMDANAFRLALKSVEDDEGIVYLDTHRHNTEVELSGVNYARIIEIINGYRIEFDSDGDAYTVSVLGANHNFADVKTVNNVSLVVNNAAGLVSTVVESVDTKKIIGHIWGAAR